MAREAEKFKCPYLKTDIVLSDERKRHIQERHPDLLPQHFSTIPDTLSLPDEIRRSSRFPNARLFTRWFEEVRMGKFVVVVVVTDAEPVKRHWIITAYMARKIVEGDIEWKRN